MFSCFTDCYFNISITYSSITFSIEAFIIYLLINSFIYSFIYIYISITTMASNEEIENNPKSEDVTTGGAGGGNNEQEQGTAKQQQQSVKTEKKDEKTDNDETAEISGATNEIDIWLNRIQKGKKGDERHKQCLEWQIDEYSTFKQLSKSKKFKNEKVMRSSLDPNEEHEPLIAELIVVLEPHWKEQSQSNGM